MFTLLYFTGILYDLFSFSNQDDMIYGWKFDILDLPIRFQRIVLHISVNYAISFWQCCDAAI
ncbi:MAG: hypothetical protein LBP87_12770 [Planctomycetaceae bacterium]|jgi:hypothetical protein|nr:hypothetical protein [Planctomycetaceae bacterium]